MAGPARDVSASANPATSPIGSAMADSSSVRINPVSSSRHACDRMSRLRNASAKSANAHPDHANRRSSRRANSTTGVNSTA